MEQFIQFVTNHWSLWLALLVVLLCILIHELSLQKRKTKGLSPQETVSLLNANKGLIIDIRNPDLFQKGHIIDAVLLDLAELNKPPLQKYKNKTLVIVCDRGLQSASVASKLQQQGYSTKILNGGIQAWQAASMPLITTKA